MRFDRNQATYIDQKIEDKVRGVKFGEVVKVTKREKVDDKTNIECDVLLRDEDKQYRNIPIMSAGNSMINPPSKGDAVIVAFLDGDGDKPIVLGNLYTVENRAPLGEAGIFRIQKGKLYIEMHPKGEWARIVKRKKPEDEKPTAKIEMEDKNGQAVINIESEGGVNLGGSGSLTLNASTGLTINAEGTLDLKTTGDVNLSGGSLSLASDNTLDIGGSGTVNLDGSSDMNLTASEGLTLDSSNSKVTLGGSSGKPVARKDDEIRIPNSDGEDTIGYISQGSGNVDSA